MVRDETLYFAFDLGREPPSTWRGIFIAQVPRVLAICQDTCTIGTSAPVASLRASPGTVGVSSFRGLHAGAPTLPGREFL